MIPRPKARVIRNALVVLAPLLAAANWATCGTDLEKVKRAADAAAATASEARAASLELQKTEQDLRDNCLLSPRSSDIYGDRCNRLVRAQGSQKSAMEAHGASVQTQMEALNRAVREANASCGASGGAPAGTGRGSKRR